MLVLVRGWVGRSAGGATTAVALALVGGWRREQRWMALPPLLGVLAREEPPPSSSVFTYTRAWGYRCNVR